MGDGFRLYSSFSPALQQAISFSRAVYELEDLSSYPITSSDNTDEAMRLTRAQKQLLRNWIDARRLAENYSTSTNFTPELVASDALNFLLTVSRNGNSSGATEQEEEDSFLLISESHIVAAKGMVERLCNARKKLNVKVAKSLKVPLWPDVTFANLYQLVCKELLKLRPNLHIDVSDPIMFT
jgi:hypothetical protein